MDPIEKVFLLQKVDLLQGARSGHLALLASIAEEVDVPAGTALLDEGAPSAALYVVVRGAVELRGVGGTLTASDGAAFGTWALIDQAPSLVSAQAREPSRLLRISRGDFQDLIGDHPELAIGLLQGLARRVRTIVT
jgi:CRP-like cAMP-binding protein